MIEEERHLSYVIEYARNGRLDHVLAVARANGEVDMQAVAGGVVEWFWTKVCGDTVAVHYSLDHCAKGHSVVGGFEREGITKVDFVLSRTFFVMRALGVDTHLFES